MNREELSRYRLRQIKISREALVKTVLYMFALAYLISKKPDDTWFYAGPCLILGLTHMGGFLVARYRLKKIRKKEIIYEVMED